MVPFLCPVCAARQTADLVALSRSGRQGCVGCLRKLSRGQVSRGIERARAAIAAGVM